MYRRHIHQAILIFIFCFIVCSLFKNVITLGEATIQNFLTFFSIILGFYITSITCLYGSKSISKLANIPDKKTPNKTLLRILLNYFSIVTKYSILCVIVCLICSFLEDYYMKYSLVKSTIISLFSLNIFFIYIMIDLLIILFTRQAINDD